MVVGVPARAQSEDVTAVLSGLSKADSTAAIKRLTFGPRPGQLATVNKQGVDAFVDEQLSKTSPDPAAESRLAQFRLFGVARRRDPVDTVRAMHSRYMDQAAAVRMELTHSNLLRAVYSDHQLYEMMCQFWMDHFTVQLVDVGHFALMIPYQEKVIRPNAMGTFRNLLKATAHAPSMLQYLDNHVSDANSPEGVNENYGRELLELHTLGIHGDGSQVYNEADVYAASQAMSGWTVEYAQGNWLEYKFLARLHGGGPLSLLNGQWTSGSASGKAVGDSMLDFLAGHESTARYLAAKLCRRFVSDDDHPALVASAAKVYLDNDTAIVPVLRHIFASEEFRQASARPDAKVRKPFEIMVAMLRAAGSDITGDPHSEQAKELAGFLEELNHRPWHWPTPDGYPDHGSSWLTTAGLVSRFNLAATIAGGSDGYSVDPARYRIDAGKVNGSIRRLAKDVGLIGLGTAHKRVLAAAVGLQLSSPSSELTDEKLTTIAGLLFAHPRFQTR